MTDEFIREAEAKKITGLSRTTRWRMERAGTFPKRYTISAGVKAYRQSELEDWLEARTTGASNDQ